MIVYWVKEKREGEEGGKRAGRRRTVAVVGVVVAMLETSPCLSGLTLEIRGMVW